MNRWRFKSPFSFAWVFAPKSRPRDPYGDWTTRTFFRLLAECKKLRDKGFTELNNARVARYVVALDYLAYRWGR